MKRVLARLALILVSLGIVVIPNFSTLLVTKNYPEVITEVNNKEKTLPEEEAKDEEWKKDKVKTIIATIKIHPDKLNCKSKGKWILAYIGLPPPYNVNEIKINTIFLNNMIICEIKLCSIEDFNNDNIPELMVKFDRCAILNLLEPQRFCLIEITGKLCDGIKFKGVCVIELIHYS